METIKVNMNPNPLDVQTIHASQNDGEARQWGFELHNNGDVIGSSEVTDQITFKAYEGGTEQILPENGSVPVTSPFKGDIKYPQGLLTDQEFLYRQSPTEEDGLAKITDIKGNTLVWNQLVHGEFGSNYTDYWSVYRGTGSVSNGELTVTDAVGRGGIRLNTSAILPLVVNHKYFISLQYKSTVNLETHFVAPAIKLPLSSSYKTYSSIETHTGVEVTKCIDTFPEIAGETGTFSIKNVMCFDLTQMGLDISSTSEFTSLFPLPYYSYNQGTLLSFMGNGIKTVGKNLFDFSQFANGTITFENGVLTGTATQFNTSYGDVVNNGIELKYPENTQITISFDARTEQNDSPSGFGIYLMASENGIRVQLATAENNTTAIQHKTVTIPSSRHIDKLGWTYGSNGQNIWHITNFQVEFGTTETEYEPYTSSTLSLPISTYFPNGMKSAGNVYDELTETKAITRVGMVDLGSLTWEYRTTGSTYAPYFYAAFTGIKPNGNPNVRKANILCSKYSTAYRGQDVFIDKTICADGSSTELTQLQIKDSSYTDATAFKQAMTDQNVKLYYELATPTETSFTTASLVTENAEIPLSNEDGILIGKCTEQLSSESGFFDAKIKLADTDGECYSNKLQLHVERSPQ